MLCIGLVAARGLVAKARLDAGGMVRSLRLG